MKQIKVKARLTFDGYVIVRANSKKEAEEHVLNNFSGRLGNCGDTTDDEVIDWEFDMCSETQILK